MTGMDDADGALYLVQSRHGDQEWRAVGQAERTRADAERVLQAARHGATEAYALRVSMRMPDYRIVVIPPEPYPGS